MTADIVLWLAQDGITNGAIYALLALALLLVFSVTRVIFVPQGEFISYAALSLALLQAGQVPGVVYVLVGGGFLVFADVLARTAIAPGQLPIGVVTAFFGAPFFAIVLRTSRIGGPS